MKRKIAGVLILATIIMLFSFKLGIVLFAVGVGMALIALKIEVGSESRTWAKWLGVGLVFIALNNMRHVSWGDDNQMYIFGQLLGVAILTGLGIFLSVGVGHYGLVIKERNRSAVQQTTACGKGAAQ